MRIDQFESDEMRRKDDKPWRVHAPPVNKPASDPNYPTKPFNHDEWMKSSKPVKEEENGIPEKGDVIRTKKMQMEGKVESVGMSSYGSPEVMFRVEDGRLMKTPLSNVIVIQKLADCNIVMEVQGERVDEISQEVWGKYQTESMGGWNHHKGANVTKNTKVEPGWKDPAEKQKDKIRAEIAKQRAEKKKTAEGSMGGLNRSMPRIENPDVSYEHVLDEVMSMWEKERTDELSVGKLKAYKNAASSPDVAKHSPLLKVVKHTQGANTAAKKIRTKTGDRTGMSQPTRGTYESK